MKRGELIVQMRWFWTQAQGCRFQAIINIFIGLVLVAVDFAFIYFSKQIIDTAVESDDKSRLTSLAVCIVLLVLSQILLRVTHRWLSSWLGVKAQNAMQEKLFRGVLGALWQGRERRHTGDVVNRLESDVSTIIGMAAERLPQVIVVIFRLIGAFVFLALMDWRLAVLVTFTLPFCILLSRVYFVRVRELTRSVRKTDSLIQSTMQELIQHQLVVKTLQQVDGAVGRLSALHRRLHEQIMRRTRFNAYSMSMINVGFSGVYLISFLWGAFQLQGHAITYGTMIAFVQLVAQIQLPFREITQFFPSLINAFTSIERLMELDMMPREADVMGGAEMLLIRGPIGLRFNDVSYCYNTSQRKILDNVSFTFPPGTFNAIVGETGVGKTTMIRLMLSLIKPQSGSIEFYGEMGSLPVSMHTRSDIVYVPQGNTLLSGTIRENLMFGNPYACEEEMIEALKFAECDFVMDLPYGLDTVCGEMGLGLSEGQAQRIAIARSMLHGGRILLLDEVTSALDANTEEAILARLKTLTQAGKTIIFVTHRQEVIDCCDNIFRLIVRGRSVDDAVATVEDAGVGETARNHHTD